MVLDQKIGKKLRMIEMNILCMTAKKFKIR